MISEGVFTLTTTITNPNTDKRFRAKRTGPRGSPTHWLKADAWKEGDRFLIKRHWEDFPDFIAFELAPFEGRTYSMDYVRITVRKSNGEIFKVCASSYDEDKGENALRALLASLRPVLDLDMSDALHYAFKKRGLEGYSAYRALHGLIKHGLVTIAEIEAELDADDEEDEEESEEKTS